MSLYVHSKNFGIPAQSFPHFFISHVFFPFFFLHSFFPFVSFLSPFVYPLLSLPHNSPSHFPLTPPPPSTQAQSLPSFCPSLAAAQPPPQSSRPRFLFLRSPMTLFRRSLTYSSRHPQPPSKPPRPLSTSTDPELPSSSLS